MDKLNLSLDQIIKLQKKEKKELKQKLQQKKKLVASGTTRGRGRGVARGGGTRGGPGRGGVRGRGRGAGQVATQGFRQFRGRVGGKKVSGVGQGLRNTTSPLKKQNRNKNQAATRQQPTRGLKNQQTQARKAVKQAQMVQQQKLLQQNRRNQRGQIYNQRRGLQTQNTGIKQRVGFNRGQQAGRGRSFGRLQMDMVTRQPSSNSQQRRLKRNNQQQQQQQQQQRQPAQKRRWGRTQQTISDNPILQVSIPNRGASSSVSVQLSPTRPGRGRGRGRGQVGGPLQQRRLNTKLGQVEVVQNRQQRKQQKQQQSQNPQNQSRLISNLLAQSHRQQEVLQNQVSHLQQVIQDIQRTNVKKQPVNVNRTEFARRGTGIPLNDRFSPPVVQQPNPPQLFAASSFERGRGRGRGRRGRGGSRTVFL